MTLEEIDRRMRLADAEQAELQRQMVESRPPIEKAPSITDTHVWEMAEIAMLSQRVHRREVAEKTRIIEQKDTEIARLRLQIERLGVEKAEAEAAFKAMTHTIKKMAKQE